MKKLVLIAVMLMASVSAHTAIPDGTTANILDGNKLYAYCTSSKAFGQDLCYGYITGISDLQSSLGLECTPPNVNVLQLGDIAIKYLREHPAERHFSAATTVGGALMLAFPCKATK